MTDIRPWIAGVMARSTKPRVAPILHLLATTSLTCLFATPASSSCNTCPVRYLTVPWTMRTCSNTITLESARACTMACVSDPQCVGVSVRLTGDVSCTLCSVLTGLETAGDRHFLMPYTHRADSPAVGISIPCYLQTGFAIFISAVVRHSRFGLFLHEQNCDSGYRNCAVDFFADVGIDYPGRENVLIFDKKNRGLWDNNPVHVGNGGAFVKDQVAHILLVILPSHYMMIVNGREMVRFPRGPYEISTSAKVTADIGSPQFIAFYCPAQCV